MGWTEVGQSAGNQDFLKIEAGQQVKLHVLTEEPHSFYQHFFNSIQMGAVCPGEGCPACAANNKELSKRMQHTFAVCTEAGEVKVWAMGNRVAEMIKNVYDTYSGLGEVDLVVKRTGTGQQTKYGVTPVPTSIDLSGVDMSALPNLEEINAPAAPEAIEQMMNGIDPRTEFDPNKLEAASKGEETAEEQPAPKPKPQPAKPTAKGPDPRMPLVKEIMGLLATNPKYKTQVAKAALFKACAPGKTTMSAMTTQDLVKLRNALKK